MKEAYGGMTNIYLFLFFFVVYVSFLAFALQFAKAYRVKNYVIDVLEQGQYDGGSIENNGTNSTIESKLNNYFNSIPYKVLKKVLKTFAINMVIMLILLRELVLLNMVKIVPHIIRCILLLILVCHF